MPIDNFAAAQDLTDRLKATIPFRVQANKQLLARVQNEGYLANTDTSFDVDLVAYSGDIGGINCGFSIPNQNELPAQQFVVSITHLQIDPNHPLAAEVQDYQRRRIRGLKLSEKGGFALELLSQQHNVQSRRKKGFGK